MRYSHLFSLFEPIMTRRIINLGILFVGLGCGVSTDAVRQGELVYDLAHNTERSAIIEETSAVLRLNNYTIEYVDLSRERAALQTYWRTTTRTVIHDTVVRQVVLRDRAILHITPRGRSTVVTNVYWMVNATLEFELQAQQEQGGAWEPTPPPQPYLQLYSSIVKDIRNRMLKYRYEL